MAGFKRVGIRREIGPWPILPCAITTYIVNSLALLRGTNLRVRCSLSGGLIVGWYSEQQWIGVSAGELGDRGCGTADARVVMDNLQV